MLLALCHDPLKARLLARSGPIEALGVARVLLVLGGAWRFRPGRAYRSHLHRFRLLARLN